MFGIVLMKTVEIILSTERCFKYDLPFKCIFVDIYMHHFLLLSTFVCICICKSEIYLLTEKKYGSGRGGQ